MKIYILKEEWNKCSKGTKFYFQDNMYYGKTITEMDVWLSVEEVENNPERFREQTILESVYHCEQIKA